MECSERYMECSERYMECSERYMECSERGTWNAVREVHGMQ